MGVLPNPGDEFGEYHIVGVLGRGGMGVVYTAVQRRLNRTVALKVLSLRLMEDPEQRARFVHEAAVLSQLDSPHITHIYDTGEVNGCLFIATQLVRGGDLGDLLHRDVPLGLDVALDVTMQIASALDDAHAAGVIHRDVKPSNVLLRDGTETFAYLCDFGIARSANSLQTTATGHVTGTWAYLAPERVNGASASARTDIYSLGCLLWASLTGEAPYQGSNEVHVALQHTTAPIPQLVDDGRVEELLNGVLVRSMAKRPEHRYERAGDMRADLAAVAELVARPGRVANEDAQARLTGPPISVIPSRTPVQPPPDPPRSPPRHWLAGLIAAALLVAAAGTVATVVLSNGDEGGGSSAGGSATPTATASTRTPQTDAADRTRRLVRVSYDGDARSDVAIQEFDEEPTIGENTIVVLRSTGDALEKPEVWRTLTIAGEPERKHRLNGDFDGDGKTDAAIELDSGLAGPTFYVLRSNGKEFGEPDSWGDLDNQGRSDQIVPISGDFDGDGDADVLVSRVETDKTRGMRLLVLESTKRSFRNPTSWGERPWVRTRTKLIPGDLNDDGRTDLLVVQTQGPDQIICSSLISKGDGFAATKLLRTLPDSTFDHVKPLVGDFDGDGTTDVLVFHDAPAGGVETLFLKGDGTGLAAPVSWWDNPDWKADESWMSVGDFDDDGTDDVARIGPLTPTSGVEVWILKSTGRSLDAGTAPWGTWPIDRPHDDTRTLNRIG